MWNNVTDFENQAPDTQPLYTGPDITDAMP